MEINLKKVQRVQDPYALG